MHAAMTDPSRRPDGAAGAATPRSGAPQAGADCPVLDSAELLRGARSVGIRHNGELYRLQLTRQGKLILTK